MSRWCTLTSLLWLWAINPAGILAQSPPWPGYAPDAAYHAGYYPDGSQGIVPAGWHSPLAHGSHKGASKQKQKGYHGGMGPLPSGPGRTIYEQLPDDRGWMHEGSPVDGFLSDMFRHAYFHVEYLLWDISDPGNTFLGAGSNFVSEGIPANLRDFFPRPDANAGEVINVTQPSLRNVRTNENNGIRATFGLPVFNAGTFEASFFGLQTNNQEIVPPGVRQFSPTLVDTNGDGTGDTFISVPAVSAAVQGVMINGQLPPGDNFLLVNGIDTNNDGIIDTATYRATLRTQVWGTEGNFLFEPYNPNNDMTFSPFLGFRYLNFREGLRQRGIYEDPVLDADGTAEVDPVTGRVVTVQTNRRIDSRTINNLYGPQVGMRAELRRKWFAIGATPKVMLGVNSYRADLETEQVLRFNDPSQRIIEKGTTFGLLGDIEVYSRIYLGEHLSAFVGYNFMYAGMITRPADNIRYNVNTATIDRPIESAFDVDVKYSGAIIQGLSIGGQIEY